MFCETSQCSVADKMSNGIPYLYGSCSQYEVRCRPVGDVTRRVLRSWAKPLHSSINSIQLKSPLYKKYKKERMICGKFVSRTVVSIPLEKGMEIKVSELTAPYPSFQRWEIPLLRRSESWTPWRKSSPAIASETMHLCRFFLFSHYLDSPKEKWQITHKTLVTNHRVLLAAWNQRWFSNCHINGFVCQSFFEKNSLSARHMFRVTRSGSFKNEEITSPTVVKICDLSFTTIQIIHVVLIRLQMITTSINDKLNCSIHLSLVLCWQRQ